jgi:predicted DNA binding CopG/RHH family protein
MKNYKLSKEEQQILKSFKNLKSTHDDDDNFAAEKQIAMQAAESFTKKSERINIRLTPYDLNHIKRIATKEGIPYQTLVSSILHKYAAGYLKIS